jgi:phage tail-like protein
LPTPSLASSHTPPAIAGTSITAPVSSPFQNPHRGGNATGSRVLTLDGMGSAMHETGASARKPACPLTVAWVGTTNLAARFTPGGGGIQSTTPSMPSTTENRSYAAAHFGLELDGAQSIGVFRSIEGGGVRSEVMTYQHGGGLERWRQLGKPKFEDIKLQVGMAMSKPFYDWIKHFFKGQPKRKTGAIIAADFYYKERARREFKEAMIKELTFPKLEGQDKNAAYMSVGIAVEDIVFKKGSGAKLPTPKMNPQKLWTACNFRFELSGFNAAVRRCAKIDSFTVKQELAEYHMGGQLSPIKTPTPIEFPNIVFYVPEIDAQPLFDQCTNKI